MLLQTRLRSIALANSRHLGNVQVPSKRCATSKFPASMASHGNVYVVLVKGKVKEGQAALFEKCFAPLAAHVSAKEPGCLSYKLSWGDTDPDSLIIFERYTSKEYLEEVHWKSEPFAQFRKDLEANGVEWTVKEVTKYYETGPGFMAR